MTQDTCPYGANECPKNLDVKSELDRLTKSLSTLTRIVYVMCGVMMCELGVTIL